MRGISMANDQHRYGWVAVMLHWVMAALLVSLMVLGFYMVRLPDVGFDSEKITLILWHKALGMTALLLAMARLGWRLVNDLPRFVDGLPDWQQVAATFVHLWLYALMLALPLTGWLNSSAGGYPTPFFGKLQFPDLIGLDPALFDTLLEVHHWLGYALAFFVLLHAGAALEHHFVRKDETLRKILPQA